MDPEKKTLMEIPYFFNNEFHNALVENFAENSLKNIMLIIGAAKIGKTRGIKAFLENMTKKGRLCIHLDFSMISNSSSLGDVHYFLEKSISISFSSLIASLDTLKSAADIVSIVLPMEKSKTTMKIDEYRHYLSETFRQLLIPSFDLGMRLSFEILKLFSGYLDPIIYIQSPETLWKSGNKSVNDLFETLKNNVLGQKDLPIIIEISDQSIYITDSISLPTLISRVNEFDYGKSKEFFVDKFKTFTPNEHQSIINAFGGHGGLFSMVYTEILANRTIDQAIKNAFNTCEEQLIRSIDSFKDPNSIHKILKKLNSDNIIEIDNRFYNEISHLLHKNIVCIKNRQFIEYQNNCIKQCAINLMGK